MGDDAAGVCSVMYKWLNECSEPVDESVLQVQAIDQKIVCWFEPKFCYSFFCFGFWVNTIEPHLHTLKREFT